MTVKNENDYMLLCASIEFFIRPEHPNKAEACREALSRLYKQAKGN